MSFDDQSNIDNKTMPDVSGSSIAPSANPDVYTSASQGVPLENIGRLHGIGVEIEDMAASMASPVISQYDTYANTIQKVMGIDLPGSKYLTHDEAKKKYPNVDFVNGGYERNIKYSSDSQYNQNYRNALLNSMPSGILSGIVKATPQILSGIAFVGATPEYAAAEAAEAAEGISEIATKNMGDMLTKGAVGTSEFTASTLPYTYLQKFHQEKIQQPIDSADLAEGLASNAGLAALFEVGGAAFKHYDLYEKTVKPSVASAKEGTINLFTKLGLKRSITPEAEKAAVDTAEKQIANGEDVNVDPIIKDGRHAERVRDPIPNDEEIEKQSKDLVNSLKKDLENHNSSIDDLEKQRDSLIDKVKNSTKKAAVTMKDYWRYDNHDATKGLFEKRYGDELLNKLTKKKEVKGIDEDRVRSILDNNIKSDRSMLKKELGLKTKRLLSLLGKKVKNESLIKTYEKSVDRIKGHLEEIKGARVSNPFKDDLEKAMKIHDKMKGLMASRDQINKVLNSDAVLSSLKGNGAPLTKEELGRFVDERNSYLNDDALMEEDKEALRNAEKPTTTEPSEPKEDMKLSDIENDLDDKEKEFFEKSLLEIKKSGSLEKILKAFKDCIDE